jgi:hypothetical protein
MAKIYPTGTEITVPEVLRFWENVKYCDSGCWEWRGSMARSNYGWFTIAGERNTRKRGTFRQRKGNRRVFAHRFSYFLHHGVDPDDLVICHRCDNPPCINPAHLFLGTHADNVHDMIRKGRANWTKKALEKVARGEGHQFSKLTEAAVRDIRGRWAAGGGNMHAMAREYGVAVNAVYQVIRRITWKHVS